MFLRLSRRSMTPSALTCTSPKSRSPATKSLTLTFAELYAAAAALCVGVSAARRFRQGGPRVFKCCQLLERFFVSYAGILLAGAISRPNLSAIFAPTASKNTPNAQAAILNNAGVCLLLTFRRAESVAKLLKAASSVRCNQSPTRKYCLDGRGPGQARRLRALCPRIFPAAGVRKGGDNRAVAVHFRDPPATPRA